MSQGVPSTSGQIAPEAWRAMSEAARRAGLPLDEWLKAQLLASHAGAAQTAAAAGGSVEELQRRVAELSRAIDRLVDTAPSAIRQSEAQGAVESEAAAASTIASAAVPTAKAVSAAGPSAPAPGMASPAAPNPSTPTSSRPISSSPSPATPRSSTATLPGAAPARPSALAATDRRIDAAIRQINERLDALNTPRLTRSGATRADAATAAAEAPPSPAAIEAAVAEIAARQHQLDQPSGAPTPRPARSPVVTAPLATSSALMPPAAGSGTGSGTGRAAGRARPAPAADPLDAIQGELGEMRHAIAALAPRQAVDDLQRAVTRLADRAERTRIGDEELRSTLAALRERIGEVKRPEPPGLLMGRVEALERKIDLVNAKTVDGASIARLQAQAGEIRELLARALSTDALRLLAEQVALLAGRIGQIPRLDEDTLNAAVAPISRRIDALAERIGSPAPAVPVDDILARLDLIQKDLAESRRAPPAGLEQLFRTMAERLERVERPAPAPDPGPRFDALSRQVTEIGQKLDRAAAPAAQISGQLSTIERAVNDLFIQMEETRATVFAQMNGRPHPGGGSGGPHALLKREIAALEAARAAATPPSSGLDAASAGAPAAAAPAHAGRAAPQPSFTPPPASIPKPFEPQLMRAALEELTRSPLAAAAYEEPEAGRAADDGTLPLGPYPPGAYVQGAPGFPFADDTAPEVRAPREPSPGGGSATAGAPHRTHFIAQARRAAQPAGRERPEPGARLGGARPAHSRPPRWQARVRAMLLIGACGSALAYGSWHLLGTVREGEERAAAPAGDPPTVARPDASTLPPGGAPLPDDITGSIGGRRAPEAGRPDTAQPDTTLPGAPQPAVPSPPPGPSSMSGPEDLPAGIGGPTLRAAARSGNAGAAFEIGHRFQQGLGVPASAARAAQWFAFAMECGSMPAAYRLGVLYENGADGVPRDLARAHALYERAAQAGNLHAMHNLGVLLANGADGPPDYADAAIWFTRAAEHGLRDSQYNLAILYARGFGVAQDDVAAWIWFALAAAKGDPQAAGKRDALAAALDPTALAAARRTVQNWKPMMADARANEEPGPGASPGWGELATPRRTASR